MNANTKNIGGHGIQKRENQRILNITKLQKQNDETINAALYNSGLVVCNSSFKQKERRITMGEKPEKYKQKSVPIIQYIILNQSNLEQY